MSKYLRELFKEKKISDNNYVTALILLKKLDKEFSTRGMVLVEAAMSMGFKKRAARRLVEMLIHEGLVERRAWGLLRTEKD